MSQLIDADAKGLATCADHLRQGEAVAMPTETVYGLAADATQGDAIAKIYALKNRPQFNPLICHVPDLENARQLGVFNAAAEKLAAQFWPGPLTLVLPRTPDCPVHPLASAGLDTLAIRVPAHRVAQDLLRAFGRPVVAPSANPSGRLSPSQAGHVAAMLPDIPVLDGGDCAIGLESSIVGCLDTASLWLRAGGLSREAIEACLGETLDEVPETQDGEAKLAPGRLARHYAPKAALRLNAETAQADELLIGFGAKAPAICAANLSAKGDMAEAAAQLFSTLHALDALAETQGKRLAIMAIPEDGLGEAINDRLRRAAQS
jgi:L-threonylcarbamoyladenylate synthase